MWTVWSTYAVNISFKNCNIMSLSVFIILNAFLIFLLIRCTSLHNVSEVNCIINLTCLLFIHSNTSAWAILWEVYERSLASNTCGARLTLYILPLPRIWRQEWDCMLLLPLTHVTLSPHPCYSYLTPMLPLPHPCYSYPTPMLILPLDLATDKIDWDMTIWANQLGTS